MARPRAADLLRAVPGPADPDAGESRSLQRAGRRCRRRVIVIGAADVAIVPGAAPRARQVGRRWSRLYLDLSGRHPLADLRGAGGVRQSLRQYRTGAGLGGDGRDHSAGQRHLGFRAGALRRARKALGAQHRDDRGTQSPIWACAIGLAINVIHLPLPRIWHEVADALGRSSLGIGLLVTGAGLQLQGMFRPGIAASVAVILKLILMPVLAVALALVFGVSGSNLAIVSACAAVPATRRN